VCVWSVRAHFQLKRKSFFTQYTRQITVPKNAKKKLRGLEFFVSEFVCHPVNVNCFSEISQLSSTTLFKFLQIIVNPILN
jgi:hypothetical protein